MVQNYLDQTCTVYMYFDDLRIAAKAFHAAHRRGHNARKVTCDEYHGRNTQSERMTSFAKYEGQVTMRADITQSGDDKQRRNVLQYASICGPVRTVEMMIPAEGFFVLYRVEYHCVSAVETLFSYDWRDSGWVSMVKNTLCCSTGR